MIPDPATHVDAHAALVLPGDSERVFAYTAVPAGYRYRIADPSIAKLRTSTGLASEIAATGPPGAPAAIEVVGLVAGTTQLLAIHPTLERVCGALAVKVGGRITAEFDRYPTFRIDPPESEDPEIDEGPSFSLLQQNQASMPPLGLVPHGSSQPDARKAVSKTVLDPIAEVAGAGAPATVRIRVLDAEGNPKRNKLVSLGFKGLATGQMGSQGNFGPALVVSEASTTRTGPDGTVEQIVTCSESLYQDHLSVLWMQNGASSREIPFIRDPMVVLIGKGAEDAASGILTASDIRALSEAQTMRVTDGINTGHSVRYERTITTPAGERIVTSVAIDMLAINHTQFALLDKMLMGQSAYVPDPMDLTGQLLQYQALGGYGVVVPGPGIGLLDNQQWRDVVAKGLLQQLAQQSAFGCQQLRFEPIDPANPPPGDATLEVTTGGIVAFRSALEYGRLAAIVGGEIAIGMVPFVGDGYAIAAELWNYWGENGEIDKINMILSTAGLLMDLANVFPPAGLAGNAMLGAVRGLWKCLKEFDPQFVEFIVRNSDSVVDSVKLLTEYSMQTYRALPPGMTNPLDQAIAIVSGTLERMAAMANSVLAVPQVVQMKVMRIVADKCSRQLSAIAQEGLAHVEMLIPDRVAGLMSSMVERHGKESATDSLESIAERIESGMRIDGLGPSAGSLDALSNLGGKRVQDSLEVAARAAEEGFSLGVHASHVTQHIGAGKAFASMEDFLVCQRSRHAQLTQSQRDALRAIADATHTWGAGEFRKYLPGGQITSGAELPTSLRGHSARAEDLAHLGPNPSLSAIRDELRLDYGTDSSFPSGAPFWDLRANLSDPEAGKLRIPLEPGYAEGSSGVHVVTDYPSTGNGATAAKSGRLLPEYFTPEVGNVRAELSVGSTAYLRAPDGSVIETWTLRLIDENRVWVRD